MQGLKAKFPMCLSPSFFMKSDSTQEMTQVISEDPDDFACLGMLCVLYTTHGALTHLWTNGVKEIEKFWPAARKANDLVQWFNYQAIHGTSYGVPNSAVTMCTVLAFNFQDGFPIHNHLPQHILEQSRMHKMAVACRAALNQMWGPTVPKWVINSVLCTSFYHSADHYFLNFYLAYTGQCGLLGEDIILQRVTFLSSKKYFLARTLCSERLDDPVCRALYEACLPIDPEFANHGLTFSICA